MSDTPQTDALPIQFIRVADLNGMERLECYVPAESMRRIERAHFQICRGWADMEVALHKAKRERDEAREALRVLFEDYKQLADSGDAGFWELEDKDAAQPALRILKQKEAAK